MSLQNLDTKLGMLEKEFHEKQRHQLAVFEEKIEKTKQEMVEKIEQGMAQVADLQREPEPEERTQPADINHDQYEAFLKKPYVMVPGSKKNTTYVLIPKFYPKFQVGWLKEEVDQYYKYEVDQYSVFYGDVPPEILSEIQMPIPIKAKVSGSQIKFDPQNKKMVKKELGAYVRKWTLDAATIIKGREFDVIAEILQSGHVPFEKTPIEKQDIISPRTESIRLREYQKKAWDNFLKTGAVGIFFPTGAGKSFVGMMGLEHIRVGDRKNLIVVPKITLIEQWKYYMEKTIPDALENTDIVTYQGFKNFDSEYGLVIFDECQALPAPTFSRLSTIQTKYRMGLSATPFREDGKNHLIITLTGYPQNINWPHYMEKYGPRYHQVNLNIVKDQKAKMGKALEIYNSNSRTMFYSYRLEPGQAVADRLGLPFIHGKTHDRLNVMQTSRSFVASSVFTEGISIKDLDHIIEVDFHYGARREELQLTGRLMHSKSQKRIHDIIMTRQEFLDYEKRILVLEEKGFHVKIKDNTMA